MTDMTLEAGSLLKGGDFRIVKVLGQGGFGITYLAEQVLLGRKVAVKEFFMKDACERDGNTSYMTVPTAGNRDIVGRFCEKFLREARMIASFDNPHIVRVYDVFEENGTAYYVMEYLPGGSLSDKVKQSGRLPESEAVVIIKKIADALAYIHGQNVLHLDVKPANIMFSKNNEPVLVDFGISKHYDEAGHQTSSTPVGISKGFAPLEQYRSSDVSSFTPATDVYSLGATLFYLLTGTVPPEASDIYEDGLPPLSSNISASVKAAVTAAMQPRRKQRPQSMDAFLGILDKNTPGGFSSKTGIEESTTVDDICSRPSSDDNETIVFVSKKEEKASVEYKVGNDAGDVPKQPKRSGLSGKMKVIIAVSLVALLAVLIVSNRGSDPAPTEPVSVHRDVALQSIRLSSAIELKEGESMVLEAIYEPKDVTDKSTMWTSSNSSIVKVDASGKVTGMGIGQATVTAKCGGKSSSCSVSVKSNVAVESEKPAEITLESISLSKSELEMEEGGSTTLTVKYNPSNVTDRSLTWKSTKTDVVTVTSNGKVMALKSGSAAIIVTCCGKESYCNVTVKAKQRSQQSSVQSKPQTSAVPIPSQASGASMSISTNTVTGDNSSTEVTLSSIELPQSLSLEVGDKYVLNAIYTPANVTDKSTAWSSSNTLIAVVNQAGEVTAIKSGETKITAKSGGKQASCLVSVTNKEYVVHGTVKDASGEPLIGASVMEEGRYSSGTCSDLNGDYRLKVSSPYAKIKISYIGYKDVVLPIDGKQVVNVILREGKSNKKKR